MWRLTNSFKQTLRPRLATLYGSEQVDRLLERIALVAGRYNYLEQRCSLDNPCWDERTCMLITYGDMINSPGEPGLLSLTRFLEEYLYGIITIVHILPFFPAGGDDGFAVIDYRKVSPELGSWDDLESAAGDFRLMFDLVLNHASVKSKWFDDYLGGIAPARDYFIEVEPELDLSMVVRPRTSPLLKEVQTVRGRKFVWTTFGSEQADLDYSNPDVMLEILDILLGYINKGAGLLRLDAVAYLWKEIGTPCINHPKTHELVKLFRDVIDNVTPGTLLLTETNLPHPENVAYLGDGDQAHMVYQFSLPPLLLHTLHCGSADHLKSWAKALAPPPPGCTFLNFTASHDGIGLRPLDGILLPEELEQLIETIRLCGGFVSTRTGEDGAEQPYELNITYFDAMRSPEEQDDVDRQEQRFLCSQIIMLSLRGVPAVYFHSLTAGRNNNQGVMETGKLRSINRGRWDEEELRALLAGTDNLTGRIFSKYTDLLRKRATFTAFHPDSPQHICESAEELFIVQRVPEDGSPILCVHNVSSRAVHLDLQSIDGITVTPKRVFDHIGECQLDPVIRLEPYQCLWIEITG